MKKSINFNRYNFKIAGNLYLPEGMDENKKYPAIVVVHPAGGVKEQTAGLYAEKLSKEGFITLAFDASHQGESEGYPRYLEDPNERVEDISSAVDYLTTLPYVDVNNIGTLGICAGGGYVIKSAQTEHRIKAVGTVSAVDIGAMFRSGGTKANLETLKAIGTQRTAEANGADVKYIGWVPNSEEEFNENTMEFLKEAYYYYRTPRAQHPNSKNLVSFTSFEKIMAFTAFDQISTLLTQPLLVIAGTDADTLQYSKDAYEMANGEKDIFLIEGATHVAMYDISEYVNQAVDKLTEFFRNNLK